MQGSKRILVLLGAYLFNVFVISVILGVLLYVDQGDVESFPVLFVLICPLVIVGTQMLFILPIVKPPRLTSHGTSLCMSVLIASIVGTLLTFVFGAAVYSFVTTIILEQLSEDEISVKLFLSFLGIAWLVWSVLLLVFVKRQSQDPRPLVRLTSWLFAGSIIELLLLIPLNIMIARRSDCYCATGSFIALIFSVLASLWLFGPFMVILLVWRRRPWTKDHCFHCGYPRKIQGASVCSECGVDFKRAIDGT